MLIKVGDQSINVNPTDWKATMQSVKDAIDNNLADMIKKALIQGQYAVKYCDAEMARKLVPDLSSLNPSIVWNKAQATTIGYLVNNLNEAIAITENICLPPALEALAGAMAKVGDITCQWPPSPYAGQWVAWVYAHLEALNKVASSSYKDKLNGYNAWDAGEIAVSWTNYNSPVSEKYDSERGGMVKIWFDGKQSLGFDSTHGMAQ